MHMNVLLIFLFVFFFERAIKGVIIRDSDMDSYLNQKCQGIWRVHFCLSANGKRSYRFRTIPHKRNVNADYEDFSELTEFI
ncbi:hypothetical protein A3Q56_01546 [Intoshia linei]|uniref:Secreted protein n=1 Tax=Intoshia linei TaxID=1819745 RepID=A0A177B8T2_9BILA|nr:hypothetical protein A3Q56_01546 [Intoshia linei]